MFTLTKEQLIETKRKLADHLERYPARHIDAAAVEQALDPDDPYFITTALYWDCECREKYVIARAGGAACCPVCRAPAEEAPDSRINEVQGLAGISINWLEPEAAAGLSEHNVADRR